ncbi:MAG TPA: glycoside hydrolase family 18 protein, partial [Longimicrobiales bacterium]
IAKLRRSIAPCETPRLCVSAVKKSVVSTTNVISATAVAFAVASQALLAQPGSPTQTRIVGYYLAGTARNGFPVSSVKAEFLTHLNYAFANISADGRAILGNPCLDIGSCEGEKNPHAKPGGNFAELRRLKQRHPQLRTLISIGGWTWSTYFSDVAATRAARRRFVESVITTFFREHQGVFDGIDLDWEFPVSGGLEGNRHRPADRQNYTELVADFRHALDQLGRARNQRYLLTIGVSGGLDQIANLEVPALARRLDFINVIAYDYHSDGKLAHFNAPLDAAERDPTPSSTVRATIDAYLAAGAPANKLVLGVPFYGHGYAAVDSVRNGLFQLVNASASSGGASPNPWVGAIRYYRIPQAMRSGFVRYWEPRAGVPWLYNARTRTWITYDDVQSIGLKSDFARARGLGGIMIWELSGDDGTLLPVIHQKLNRKSSPR